MRDDADEEGVGVEQHPDLGVLGGGLTLPRLVLNETACDPSAPPVRFVDDAVELDRPDGPDG